MKKRLIFGVLVLSSLTAMFFGGSVGAQGGRTYTTNFSLTENPMSEGGMWINGQTAGLDWKNFRTSGGIAFGTQDGTGGPPYDDSTAVVSGAWGPNQTVQATVHSVNQQTGNVYEEVEIRLRTTITAHNMLGYEIMWRVNHDGTQYHQIGGNLGPINSNIPALIDLRAQNGYRGIFDGDVVKASIVGNVITSYINGVQIAQVTDSHFSSGSPGVGHWLHGPGNLVGDYGFTDFVATDGPPLPPAAPKNLFISPARLLGSPLLDLLPLRSPYRAEGVEAHLGRQLKSGRSPENGAPGLP